MIQQAIEALEPEWRPSEAKATYELLQAEIAKAFVVPVDALYSPQSFNRFITEAYRATKHLHDEAVRIYMEHCFPVILVKTEERQKSL